MASADQQAQQAYEAALAMLPAMQAPPGETNNLVDPYSLGWLITFTTVVCLTVATVLVLLRTYTKHFINKAGLQWDDYISILAWVIYIAYCFVGLQAQKYGGFTHQWNVSAGNAMHFGQIVNDLEIMYGVLVFLTKLSLLLQVLNLFAPTRSGLVYYLCLFMIAFNFLFYGLIMFVVIFICTPRQKFWNPTLPGHCMDIDKINIVSSVINATSDLTLLLTPIICVFGLQMPLRKKIGVSLVFATASFACVASIMRIVTSVQVRGQKDTTWWILPEGLWAHGEICSGIVCGCMVTLPQFFRHFVPKIKSRLGSGKSSKLSAGSSNRQIERKRKQSVQPHLDTEVYMELDDEMYLKSTEDKGTGPRVWTDEVPRDEEKALPPGEDDVITDAGQRHDYYHGR